MIKYKIKRTIRRKAFSMIEIMFATFLSMGLAAAVTVSLNQATITMRSSNSRTSADSEIRNLSIMSEKMLRSAHQQIYCDPSNLVECKNVIQTGSVFSEIGTVDGSNEVMSFYSYATPNCKIVGSTCSNLTSFTPPNKIYYVLDKNTHKLKFELAQSSQGGIIYPSSGSYLYPSYSATGNLINQFGEYSNIYSSQISNTCIGNKPKQITDTGTLSGSADSMIQLYDNNNNLIPNIQPIGSVSYLRFKVYVACCNKLVVIYSEKDIFIDLPSAEYQ